jgi:thymidylate synthase (FAD)
MDRIDILDKGFVELINCLGDDETIVRTARISYFKHNEELTDKDKEELIAKLIRNGHTSPFEQVEFQFLVKCPIFVARQWMRHRTWSYNEMSRRYVVGDCEFYIPKNLGDKVDKSMLNFLIENIEKNYEIQLEQYNFLLKFNVDGEKARIGLPVGLYTEFYAKADLHNLFHFLELRNSNHAQEEIVEYSKAIEKLIEPIVPLSYKYWKESLSK